MADSEEDILTEARPWEPPEPETLIMAERVDDAESIEAPLSPLEFDERYEDTMVLGEGGMGIVRLTQDNQIGRRVAYKVVREEYQSRPDIAKRFVREARLQGQLEHPAIVPVYDLGMAPDGTMYFTMKRVRGVDLATIIFHLAQQHSNFHERFPLRRRLAAFSQVCLAIDFAHQRGVVHRDLKPENIMLGDFGEVYVLDWGMAKLDKDEASVMSTMLDAATLPSSHTLAGDIMGTPGYMAPEHVSEGANAVDPLSDVYALGSVLFEMLALEPLHPTKPLAECFGSTLEGAEARPSRRAPHLDPPVELDAICQKATAREPKDRYGSARALHDAIEAYLGGARDAEQRRAAARKHASRAVAAMKRRGLGGEVELEGRREAMREVGRALALDPDNQDSMIVLMRLLTEPPQTMPDEVRRQLDRAEQHRSRWIGRFGGLGYASLMFYLPLLFWMGIRSPFPIVLFYASVIGLLGISAWTGYSRAPTPWYPFLACVVSSITFALTATFFGTFMLTPALIAVNTTAYAIHAKARWRTAMIAVGCLAMAIPIVLELSGITTIYAFTEAGMVIQSDALDLPRIPSLMVLGVSAIATILTSCLSSGTIRDELDRAEQHLHLYAWHLREFAPESARALTDPTDTLRGWDYMKKVIRGRSA